MNSITQDINKASLGEASLIDATKNGDFRAFNQLLDTYKDPIFRFTYARVGQVQDSEDLTQATFIRAYQKIKLYNSEYSFSNWLYTIASRQIISHFRKQKWKKRLTFSMQSLGGEHLEIPQEENKHSWIWQSAASLLSDRDYLMLWLSYAEGRTHEEIAHHLQMQKSAIKVAIHRSRNKLHEFLSKDNTVKSNVDLDSYKSIPQKV